MEKKKNKIKNIYKMDLRMSFLNSNFAMIT